MAGSGRVGRNDAPVKIGSANGFAVLESLKKKKKSSDKGKGSSAKGGGREAKETEPEVFWQPKPISNKSWADVEDEDDDDYYATTAPMESIWGTAAESTHKKAIEIDPVIEEVLEEEEETESEDGLDDGHDDIEGGPEQENVGHIPSEPLEKTSLPASLAPKETERQLSKKELKKKGIEELDALLAELGITGKDNNTSQEQSIEETESGDQTANGGKKENTPAPSESKTSKKKKTKKDKSSKEAKDSQEQHQPNGCHTGLDDAKGIDDVSVVDVKDKLKKAASGKKKKNEVDAVSKVFREAAARNARMAAAKKKEKNHYNQQPVR